MTSHAPTQARVVVTGGRGYVGGRVVRRLAEGGFDVVVTSRTAPPDGANGHLRLDLLDDGDVLTEALRGAGAVVHLAAPNEWESADDPERAYRAGLLGTHRLVEAARRAGVRRLVYMSTAHVYGAPLSGRLDETVVTRPVHPYAIAHRAAEDVVLAANDSGRLEGIVLRLSNAVGAPAEARVDRWTLVANDLCRQAVTGRALELKTSGLQRRDFVPLEDVARCVEHMLRIDRARLGDGLFNLGAERAMTVLELAETIASRCRFVAGYEPPVRRPDPRPGEASLPLEYRCAKLASTGFDWKGDIAAEIDETLRLCAAIARG